MNSSVKSVVAVVATATGLAAFGKDQFFYNVCDIAGAAIDADITQVYFNSRTDSAAFTLSADTTIPCKVGVPSGITCFDFTDGNHVLSVGGSVWVTMGNDTDVRFKGGAWSFDPTAATFYHGSYGDGNIYSRQSMLIDGTYITNLNSVIIGGRDSTLVLTNGALLATAKGTVYLSNPGNVASTSRTNVSVTVHAGSKIYSHATLFTDSETTGGTQLTGNRFLVTGAGAYVGATPGRTERLYHGNKTSGNFMRYEKGATGKFYNTYVGVSGNSKSNVLQIADSAAVTNTNDGAIGLNAGADYNRIEVLNGGVFNQAQGNDFYVGKAGSYNELYVSNGIVSNAKNLIAGYSAGATGNKVRISGRSSKLSFLAEFPTLFGCGRGNTWQIDDCEVDGKTMPISGQSAMDWRIYFSGTSQSPNSNASTNNTLRLENAARLRCYEFQYPVATEGNLAVVGNCCTLDVASAMSVRGHNNVLAVSNGVMRLPTTTLGSKGDNGTAFVESGNVLAFQGKTPVLTTYSNSGYSLYVYDSGVLRFEIPEDGYDTATPIPLRAFNTFVYSGTVEFTGLEKLTQNMTEKKVTYQLTNAGFRMYDEGGVENGDAQLAAISETLPKGCRVYRNGNLHLLLEVKRASKGIVLFIK